MPSLQRSYEEQVIDMSGFLIDDRHSKHYRSQSTTKTGDYNRRECGEGNILSGIWRPEVKDYRHERKSKPKKNHNFGLVKTPQLIFEK